jgi:hypothetical protein
MNTTRSVQCGTFQCQLILTFGQGCRSAHADEILTLTTWKASIQRQRSADNPYQRKPALAPSLIFVFHICVINSVQDP